MSGSSCCKVGQYPVVASVAIGVGPTVNVRGSDDDNVFRRHPNGYPPRLFDGLPESMKLIRRAGYMLNRKWMSRSNGQCPVARKFSPPS
jgi:hypothetical protein